MRIHCVGGGPGGLYLSILAKRANPKHEVVVWERNRPDDTFGWGVVFSDLTQSNLREADAESYDAVTRTFATWDSIRTHYKGNELLSRGHGFCGLSRKRFLQILYARAQEVGVTLNFESEVEDVESLRDCDLLVGADGVRSRVRSTYEDTFQPNLDVRPNKYIWLGSHQQLDAFTFSFRENEHGLWMLHAYQFEPETSTFIVECDPETFANSGLEATDEAASIAYCEKVFEKERGGHALLANRSHWVNFTTVTNRRWSHENVVLLGDAVHTAHFSIGSGTKIAMEDAIALSDALDSESSVPAAMAKYEQVRRPQVESIQRAAQCSLEWFESARRYLDFEPERFHFSLLTRSMRVTHDNLRVRDAELMKDSDAWFRGTAPKQTAAKNTAPPMFVPFKLRDMVLNNRVVVSPMCQYSAKDGMPNDWHLVHLGSRAVGGAGLVIAEMTDVSPEGRISPGCTGIWSDDHAHAWKRVVDFVHEHSESKIGIQLGHAGRKGATEVLWAGGKPMKSGAWPLMAPSAVPWDENSQVPKAMDRADMDEVRDQFVAAAKRCELTGFDMIEIHMAHGYLLSSFLSPLSNTRTDEYGGSLDNRARYPLEVLDAVRAVWPASKPVSVRISATDWVDGGFSGDDAVALARLLKEHGADLIDVSAGQTSPGARPQYGRAFQTPFSDCIRNEAGIATMAVGAITTYDDVNTILLAGRADLVALARAHLADPYFTLHSAREQGIADDLWPNQYRAAKTVRFLVK